MILAQASLSCDRSFIALATVIMIKNYDPTVITIIHYDCKNFIVQTTGISNQITLVL
jgi:hypothetical protein